MLSNIIIIQFHKTVVSSSSKSEGFKNKYKEWTNFFTYVHVPFLDKNVNPDIATMSEIIGRAMEKKSETKVFDCLFRKSPLLMRLQDFLFPAYPSQKDFLATQTKLQVTLSPYTDLKKISGFFSQLQFFGPRCKNDIISEQRAAIMLSKYFDDEFSKIKDILKDFSMSNELLNNKQSKNYAAPGHDDMKANAYSHLIRFLSYSNKTVPQSKLPHMNSTNYYTAGNYNYRMRDYQNRTSDGHNYVSLNSETRSNKRSVGSVGYNRQRNPISNLKFDGRVDIDKKIKLDNLKKLLSTRFDKEIEMVSSTPYHKDISSQIQKQISKFSSHTSGKPFRSYKPTSALKQRRTTTAPAGQVLLRSGVGRGDYSVGAEQKALPSTVAAKLSSNKSGPINPPRGFSRKSKRDKASYNYFISVATHSIAKFKRTSDTPFGSQPDSVKNDSEHEEMFKQINDYQSENRDRELDNKMEHYRENMDNNNIGDVVEHMEKKHNTYEGSEDDQYRHSSYNSKRPTSHQRKEGGFGKRSNKYSTSYVDRSSKYTSLREQNALNIEKKFNKDDDKTSVKSNATKGRKQKLLDNSEKIKNIYKMVPSKPIMTSVLRSTKN